MKARNKYGAPDLTPDLTVWRGLGQRVRHHRRPAEVFIIYKGIMMVAPDSQITPLAVIIREVY